MTIITGTLVVILLLAVIIVNTLDAHEDALKYEQERNKTRGFSYVSATIQSHPYLKNFISTATISLQSRRVLITIQMVAIGISMILVIWIA